MKKQLLIAAFICVSNYCLANSIDNEGINANSVNLKLWQKTNRTQDHNDSKERLIKGTFVGYSHNFRENFGLDLSVDSYLYTNRSDNSFAWMVGLVSDLIKLNYHINQKAKNQYIEVITYYPINESISLTGYAGNKYDGTDEFRDLSVGLAFSLSTSVKISAGIADRELKESDAEGNVFFNINGIF